MRTGRPTEYKPEYCDKLIEHMEKGNSFWSFAAECGVSMETISNWTHKYPDFLEAKRVGVAKLLKYDEQFARVALSGLLKRPSKTIKTTKENELGELVTKEETVHDYAQFSQSYYIFLMKNRYPRLYRDKIVIDDGSAKSERMGNKLKELMKDPELAAAAKKLARKMASGANDPE